MVIHVYLYYQLYGMTLDLFLRKEWNWTVPVSGCCPSPRCNWNSWLEWHSSIESRSRRLLPWLVGFCSVIMNVGRYHKLILFPHRNLPVAYRKRKGLSSWTCWIWIDWWPLKLRTKSWHGCCRNGSVHLMYNHVVAISQPTFSRNLLPPCSR